MRLKSVYYCISLLLTTYTLIINFGFLSLLKDYKISICSNFNDINDNSILNKTNIARWNSLNVMNATSGKHWGLFNLSEMNTTVYMLTDLKITYNDYNANFVPSKYSYAGVVGNATHIGNTTTSYPLVILVAAADITTASYFVIREEDKNPAPVCRNAPSTCFNYRSINFPF